MYNYATPEYRGSRIIVADGIRTIETDLGPSGMHREIWDERTTPRKFIGQGMNFKGDVM